MAGPCRSGYCPPASVRPTQDFRSWSAPKGDAKRPAKTYAEKDSSLTVCTVRRGLVSAESSWSAEKGLLLTGFAVTEGDFSAEAPLSAGKGLLLTTESVRQRAISAIIACDYRHIVNFAQKTKRL